MKALCFAVGLARSASFSIDFWIPYGPCVTPGCYFVKSGRQRKDGKQRYFHSRLARSSVAWQRLKFCLYELQQFSICFVYDFFGESPAPGGMWAGQLQKLMWQFSLVA